MDTLAAVTATVLVMLLAGPVVLGLGLAGYDTLRRRTTAPAPAAWLDELARRSVLVHTRDGQTISGALVRVDDDGLILEPARWEDQDLAGRAWVPRDRVAWVQEPKADG